MQIRCMRPESRGTYQIQSSFPLLSRHAGARLLEVCLRRSEGERSEDLHDPVEQPCRPSNRVSRRNITWWQSADGKGSPRLVDYDITRLLLPGKSRIRAGTLDGRRSASDASRRRKKQIRPSPVRRRKPLPCTHLRPGARVRSLETSRRRRFRRSPRLSIRGSALREKGVEPISSDSSVSGAAMWFWASRSRGPVVLHPG